MLQPFVIAVGQLIFTRLFVVMRRNFVKFFITGNGEKLTNMFQVILNKSSDLLLVSELRLKPNTILHFSGYYFSFFIEISYGLNTVLVIWSSYEYTQACKTLFCHVRSLFKLD